VSRTRLTISRRSSGRQARYSSTVAASLLTARGYPDGCGRGRLT
jgi:hypothetical protein